MAEPHVSNRRVECTYKDCHEKFGSEKAMKGHKRHSDEHDYCHKCDEDFDTYDDYVYHKIIRPDNHHKACRVCGDEFKSSSGLKLHIDLNHKVDQKLTCIGCQQSFHRACLLIEHLEFGHCNVISAGQFQNHIIHKSLLTDLMQDSDAYDRFIQKQAKYDAAVDVEEEGGVGLGDPFEDQGIEEVQFKAIQPNIAQENIESPINEPYPLLPSQKKKAQATHDGLESSFQRMSLSKASGSATANSVKSSETTSKLQPKAWGKRDGKTTSNVLFPNAKPTPALRDFSIAAHDNQEQVHGQNIMRIRFWDPQSRDWNPDRFWDAITCKYYCPFICEQTFATTADLTEHIHQTHRLTRIKCPMCMRNFKSVTGLIAHFENRTPKCEVNRASDFYLYLDKFSGGFLAVEEKVRPDHMNNPCMMIRDEETGHMERYSPLAVGYQKYRVTTPPDWQESEKTYTIR